MTVTDLPPPKLSVVLPVYNEAQGVELALRILSEMLEPVEPDFEIVCVDDGSRDESAEHILAFAARDPRVRLAQLSRNFGKEAAMAAGLDEARGKGVLLMDADLQHPPDVVPRMIELWREGYDVVNAVKEERARENPLYRAMAGTFNRLMSGVAAKNFRGASDFKLLDRQVVDVLRGLPERNRFFRGLVAWVGFRTVDVPFSVKERIAGETKWSTWGLVKYSARNLISFSSMPLRVIAGIGFVTLIFAGLLAIQTLGRYLVGEAVSGFTTVILLQLLLGGLILTSLGVIAIYLAELFDEVKQRPVFIIRRQATRSDLPPSPEPLAGAVTDEVAPAPAESDPE